MSLIDVVIKVGAAPELRLEGLPAETTTVGNVKQLVEERTGVFSRRQKIVLKGKVLSDDSALLAPVGGAGGKPITLMLLAAPGGASAAAPASSALNQTRGAAAAKAAAAAAAEARLKRAREGAGAGGAGGPPPPRPPQIVTWQARRDAWGKTGIVAYREAGASEGLDREAAEWAASGGNASSPSSSNPHAQLFAGLAPVAATRAMDLSGNAALKRLPRAVFSPQSLQSSLQSLRLAGCGLTTDGVPWASLPPGLTSLALDRNAIGPLVPRMLSELDGEEQGGQGQGEEGTAARRTPPKKKKFARLAVLTLSHNRIERLEPGALMFARGGGGSAAAPPPPPPPPSAGSQEAPPPSLRALDLSHNQLEALPWDDMSQGALSSVVELDCRHNRVRALEPPPPVVVNPLSRRMPALRSLRLDSNMVRGPLPASLFGGGGSGGGSGGDSSNGNAASAATAAGPADSSQDLPCPSLSVLILDDNPITAQEMRQAEGWQAFDARRVRNATKRIESGALLGRSTFSEGADAADWERYK